MKVTAKQRINGVRISDVEALWYDVRRWPSFIDGFAHEIKREDGWPEHGGRLIWDSTPAGRGRVVEKVIRYEPRVGQDIAVEDPTISGTQRVSFTALDAGAVEVALELDYTLKQKNPLSVITDLLFIRRAQRDALKRTLVRFARELAAEADEAER